MVQTLEKGSVMNQRIASSIVYDTQQFKFMVWKSPCFKRY